MPLLDEAAYLNEVARRAASVLGDELVGAYAGGSWALGDFLRGRSDLDVAIVCAAPLGDAAIDGLAHELAHEALPCPARGLELVVYTREVARAGRVEPGFELNLNTGARMARRLERRGGTDESHWFAIDRSLLAEHGQALRGPPAGEVFRSPPRAVILDLLGESLRWHAGGGGAADDAALNAARSIFYAREGRWTSKPRAARWLIERGEWAGLTEAALAAREGRGPAPDASAVRDLVRAAAEVVAEAARVASRGT